MTTPSIIVGSNQDWKFDDIYKIYDEIEKVGIGEMGLDIYPNQIEVISSEQMLDSYSSHGLPIMYHHWSFGKQFIKNRKMYYNRMMNLAYEIVLNTSPCIEYIMEENSLLMQTLVIAHAGFGHNTVFKTNYLFKQWTNAGNIMDYMEFARKFVDKCEEKYGVKSVEKILDAAHSIMHQGVFKYPRKERLTIKEEMARRIERALEEESSYNDLWKTLPTKESNSNNSTTEMEYNYRKERFGLPEENLLYFIEQYSPKLKNWEKEIVRIVRNVAQYFVPQMQSQTLNEGAATHTHYSILNRLYEKGILTDGAMLEFLHSHTGVTFQPNFNEKWYSGINPYALGFAMMQDIKRICHNPTEEDNEWFPDFAGCKDENNVLKDVWANYRDESFIRQFLSPKVMRDFKFFSLETNPDLEHYLIKNIHNERGYRTLRQDLANSKDISSFIPEIEVRDFDIFDTRKLILDYIMKDGKELDKTDMGYTLKNIANLWGYDVQINIVNSDRDRKVINSYIVSPSNGFNSGKSIFDDIYST